ncbi:hypothetical protein J7T55_009494 [Diaporthe amygdali]|uniref:uncharacterized protein n=1 Tax=Phomopsis amygdali TaxID=1214568 RepID=UPI0022FDC830|nr:uncharacterized protein J7T55_009494 [Diaporthe amygdali]KAJ0109164.1 hypothetical protein J7T55_009494 [Diaporthe amygdali]
MTVDQKFEVRHVSHWVSSPTWARSPYRTMEAYNLTKRRRYKTLFAVPMTCEGCVKDVSDSLYKVDGISKVEANLKEQMVRVEGTAPPSAIVATIEATGRDAILRGSGTSNSSAVSILETYAQLKEERDQVPDHQKNREVRGLARMVEVSKTVTLVDLTIRGVEPGTYRATIREYGNLAEGASSTGPVWKGDLAGQSDQKSQVRGELGNVEIGPGGRGSIFLDRPFQVWEVIGHAFVVSRQGETDGKPLENDDNTVVGVIARSAGMWDNDKTVCSCTGKTLWEERKDEVRNGML